MYCTFYLKELQLVLITNGKKCSETSREDSTAETNEVNGIVQSVLWQVLNYLLVNESQKNIILFHDAVGKIDAISMSKYLGIFSLLMF